MIPVRDVMPARTFPAVTVSLIILNVIVFAGLWLATGGGYPGVLDAYGLPHTPSPSRWVQPLTMMFLHEHLLLLAGNMVCLWIFGENVEDRTGRGPFALFYLIGGLAASATHVWTTPLPGRAVVGASGAVAAVLGGYFRLYPRPRILLLVPLPFLWSVVEAPALGLVAAWVVLHTVAAVQSPFRISRSPNAAAHVVAFAAGWLLVRRFARRERLRPEWWHDASRLDPGGPKAPPR